MSQSPQRSISAENLTARPTTSNNIGSLPGSTMIIEVVDASTKLSSNGKDTIEIWKQGRRIDLDDSVSQASGVTVDENQRWIPDYVLVYDNEDYQNQPARVLYEKELRKEGLDVHSEKLGQYCFVKIVCPFDRLCFEAEQVKLEMPLKDVRSFYTLKIRV